MKLLRHLKQNNEEHFNNEIKTKLKGRACSDLVEKYKDDFAIWNFVEIISFNDFRDLYSLFYSRNKYTFCNRKNKENFKGEYYYLINPVKLIRNASAHNNCLLIGLNKAPASSFNFEHKISQFLGKNGIKNPSLDRQLSKPIIHDLCVLLFLYSKVAPIKAQQHTYKDLKVFFGDRVIKNKDYYKNNSLILSAYEFIVKVIDIFYNSVQNDEIS